MTDSFTTFSTIGREPLFLLVVRILSEGRPVLLRSDLLHLLSELTASHGERSLGGSPLARFVSCLQEAVVRAPWVCFAHREGPGLWRYVKVHAEQLVPEEVSCREFLAFKERLVPGGDEAEGDALEIDLTPFGRGFPRLTEPRSIGQGLTFLNRQLAGALLGSNEGLERLHDFLALHAIGGRPLLLRGRQTDVKALRSVLRMALRTLERESPSELWSSVAESLATYGLEPGWGDTAGAAAEMVSLLVDILEAPSPEALESFLARVPMIARVLVVSPHGFFGQSGVLGLPDTGGQVVYILDQVRALEVEMRSRLARQGVPVEPRIVIVTRLIPEARGTTCDQRLERVEGCRSAVILRVPFRRPGGEVVRPWVSRFEVWPFLERFARDAEHEAVAELGGRPDLVLGNYSDGNVVASRIGRRLGVTTATIAHALEKTKYLLSALHWRENEDRYHFSCQYTADLIAMNSADFIIASTYQEIAGTADVVGQYESYGSFTMPGLYRVLGGVDVYDPRFNLVSPGADSEVYFSASDSARRLAALHPQLKELVFGGAAHDARGGFEYPDRPLLFTLARLDRIKNVTGLVSLFALSERLRGVANLLIVSGDVDPDRSADREEAEQARLLHALMDRHALDASVRWVGRRLEKPLAGELYRFVADRRGVFVQPALFEAFGLTVVEAMSTGLPVFATCHGGPAEIIEDGRSGFHIDPNDGGSTAEAIASFLERCAADPSEWSRVSRGALARVEARYTWRRYAERVMTFARIYGFWKFVKGLEREETDRYLHLLDRLVLRPRTATVPLPR